MSKRKFFIFLIGAFFEIGLSQVSIEGFIFDAKTFESVKEAELTVRLMRRDKIVFESYMLSDKNGYYVFKFDSSVISNTKALILVRKQGYRDFYKEIEFRNSVVLLNVYLYPLEYWLDTIKVEAGKMILSRIPTFTLKSSDMNSLPIIVETDVLRSIRFLPGVVGETDLNSRFSIRGVDPGYNVVLIDGVRILNPYHFGGITSAINSDIVNSINLFTGAYPVEYSGTISGIIDVRTREIDTSRIRLSGNLSLLSSSVNLNLPILKSGLISGFRRTYYDIFALPYYFYDFYLKASHGLGKSSGYRNYISFLVYLSRDIYDIFKWDSGIKVKNEPLAWGNLLSYFRLAHRYNNIEGEILLYLTSFTTQVDSRIDRIVGAGIRIADDEIVYVNNKIANYGFKFCFNVNFEKIGFTFGLNSEKLDLKYNWNIKSRSLSDLVGNPYEVFFDFAPSIFNYRWGSKITSGYLNLNFKLPFSVELNAGLKGDYISWWDKVVLNPYFRVDYFYKLANIFLIFRRNYQAMIKFGERQRGDPFSEFKLPFPAKETMYPYSNDLEVGFEVNNFVKGLNLKAEFYWKEAHSIPYISDIDLNEYFYDENSMGFDFFARIFRKRYNLGLSYTFGKVIRKQEGARFPGNYDLRHNIKAFASVNLNNRTELSLSWVFNSGLPYSKPYFVNTSRYWYGLSPNENSEKLDTPIYIYLNNYRSPYYHRLDLTIKYYFLVKVFNLNGKFGIYLTVVNLYAKRNKIFMGFDERVYKELYYEGFPLAAIIGLSFSF